MLLFREAYLPRHAIIQAESQCCLHLQKSDIISRHDIYLVN